MAGISSNTPENRERTVLFSGLGAALLLWLILSWLPLRISLSHFVFEDSFYYLRVACSIVAGNGSTFDGIHPTNGYHPLWMLVSIALVAPFERGAALPVHLLLSLCAVVHVLTALLIYRVVQLGGNSKAAVVAALVWAFNYHVAAIAICGLETALFALLAMATIYYYAVRRHGLSARQSGVAGLLVGLTALARFDGALLGFALAADQLFLSLRRRESARRVVERLGPVSVVGSLMMAPWIVWSLKVSGTILPNSHRALRLWLGSGRFDEGFLRGLFNIFSNYAPDIGKMYGLAPFSSVSLILVGMLFFFLARGREKRAVGLPVIVFTLYPIAHALYYALGFAPLNRYLFTAHMVVFTGLMTLAGCWLLANRSRRITLALGFAALALIVVNLSVTGAQSWRQGVAAVRTHSLHWTMFNEVLPWIKQHVRADERIGSFNCGIFGYFSGRTVVNLDGVINDSVIPALEEERLIRYLRREQITYVIDWETTLDAAFTLFGGVPDYRSEFQVVKTFEQPWGPYKGARILVLRLLR